MLGLLRGGRGLSDSGLGAKRGAFTPPKTRVSPCRTCTCNVELGTQNPEGLTGLEGLEGVKGFCNLSPKP